MPPDMYAGLTNLRPLQVLFVLVLVLPSSNVSKALPAHEQMLRFFYEKVDETKKQLIIYRQNNIMSMYKTTKCAFACFLRYPIC